MGTDRYITRKLERALKLHIIVTFREMTIVI